MTNHPASTRQRSASSKPARSGKTGCCCRASCDCCWMGAARRYSPSLSPARRPGDAARLQLWLRDLAMGDDASVRKFFASAFENLSMRKLQPRATCTRCVAGAARHNISTFTWFMQFSARAAECRCDQVCRCWNDAGSAQAEAWRNCWNRCASSRQRRGTAHAVAVRRVRLFTTRKLLFNFIASVRVVAYTQGNPMHRASAG